MNSSVQTHTLIIGLVILTREIHTVPLVSQWIWYRVGSRNEVRGKTGISHWVEHMQFKGTPNTRSTSRPGHLARRGFWNAMTSLDWTTYFETLPSDNWKSRSIWKPTAWSTAVRSAGNRTGEDGGDLGARGQ
jgi:zinc protease